MGEQVTNLLLKRGEVTAMYVVTCANHATARHGRENDDLVEKAKPRKRAQAPEMKRDCARAAARES